MNKKSILAIITFIVILASPFVVISPAYAAVDAIQTIVIQPDGSISPSTVPIKRTGDTYTFTGNVSATMRIHRSNIELDGAGYTLHGPYNGTALDVWVIGEGSNQLPENVLAQYTIGIDLANRDVQGITIKNLNILNFSIGMYMWTNNNTVTGNSASYNILGILLSGSNSTITNNYISHNTQGLFFGFNDPSDIPSDIIISHNGFESNKMQINGCLCDEYPENEPPHSWDNGEVGNYWSDYNGTDAANDGFGDTPYVVDIQNQDRYPFMQNPAKPPVPSAKLSFDIIVLVIVIVPIVLVVATFALREKKFRRKKL
jgi:parallel beta-helix repeat protein